MQTHQNSHVWTILPTSKSSSRKAAFSFDSQIFAALFPFGEDPARMPQKNRVPVKKKKEKMKKDTRRCLASSKLKKLWFLFFFIRLISFVYPGHQV